VTSVIRRLTCPTSIAAGITDLTGNFIGDPTLGMPRDPSHD
jgi:hypothetical protein